MSSRRVILFGMVTKHLKGWTPAVPLKRPDSIISSEARQEGQKGFIPSYEKVRFDKDGKRSSKLL